MAVAEVDHGSDTATAVTSASAICPSRGARTACFTTADSRLRSDMVLILRLISASIGGFTQRRQSALRTLTIAL
jgi:hypothetical protein